MIKIKTRHLLMIACLAILPVYASANDIEPSQEYFTALPATSPVVLDGILSEWDISRLVQDPRFAIPKGSGDSGQLVSFESLGGDWTGVGDHSASFMVSYDADNVYVGVLVIDDYHENAAASAWNGDSLQMMVANSARDSQVGLYNFALSGVESALGSLIVNIEAGPGGADAAISRQSPVTIYEIQLPMSSLGLTELTPGTQFGLGFAINDGDELAPGQQGWSGWGPHALVYGKSPSETGLVTLGVPEPGTIGMVLLGVGILMTRRRR
ncbi:MAG: PEP-CTERM sorting domain-containing protein [Planctomycetales bacterium]|nr:PEP-CTERM sorting domain-containing protein [Planctomycetales bacterium]